MHDLQNEPCRLNYKSIELLFKKFNKPLCSKAEGIVGNKEYAEDIVSDFFLTLLEKGEEIHISECINSYLFTSIKKNCLKYLEKDKHFECIRDDAPLIVEHNDPFTMMLSQEKLREIENAIKTLPAQCRELLEERIDGLSYKEIVKKTGIKEDSIGVQISRAREKLKKFREK